MVSRYPFVEVRLDTLAITPDDVRQLFGSGHRLIATCRPGRHSDPERIRLLSAAIEAGAAYVDLELEAVSRVGDIMRPLAARHGCRLIVSHHDYTATPPTTALRKIIYRCFGAGADLAKVACYARHQCDAARLLGLLDSERSLVVIGMGPLGRITRIVAPLLGAPFTFVAAERGAETAPGQLDLPRAVHWLESLDHD